MYYQTANKKVDFANESEVTESYAQGFVFTRLGKGEMIQTRSLRIDLDKFELSSENRRVLKKVEGLKLKAENLPLENYSWEIHKLGKDFYSTKFGDNTMSAAKIKEMFTEPDKSNMNIAMSYELRATSYGLRAASYELRAASEEVEADSSKLVADGYCLCYQNPILIHYAYPFYNLEIAKQLPNLGLGMMINAIIWAKENGKQYIYLGSVTDSSSKYKLQFEGLEWWDGLNSVWSSSLDNLKDLLA